MNGQLRGLDKSQIKADVSFDDADLERARKASKALASAIRKAPPLEEPMTVFRGFSADQFGDLKPGMQLTDKGFVSTSLTPDVAPVGRASRPATAEIILPEGTKAAAGSAREMILPPRIQVPGAVRHVPQGRASRAHGADAVMSRFLWQADELVQDDEYGEDLAERFNPNQPRDRLGRWTDGPDAPSIGGLPGGGHHGSRRPGTGTRTVSTSRGHNVAVTRNEGGSGSITMGGTSRSLTPGEFDALAEGIGTLEYTPIVRRTDLPVGGQRPITGPDGSTLAVAKRTGHDTFTLHLSPRPGASEQETADAPGIDITAKDAGKIGDRMREFKSEEEAAERAERERIRQERVDTGATNPADVARRASSSPPPPQDSNQGGMPPVVASEEIPTAGDPVSLHKKPGDDSIHVSQGGRSVALTTDELHSINDIVDMDDGMDVGETIPLHDKEGFAFGSVTKTGRNTFDVNIDGQQTLTGIRPGDMDKITKTGERIEGSGRVDTQYGPVDVFATGRRMGIRHIGDDGRPVEVTFTRTNIDQMYSAMTDLLDRDLGPGETAAKDVKTAAGPVRVELRGPWGEPDSVLFITPIDGGSWGVVVDGPNMDAFRNQFELSEAATPRRLLDEQVPLAEAAAAAGLAMSGPLAKRRFRARLIQGDVQGSCGYYPAEMLRRHADVFQPGLPVFVDHPAASEAYERPERSVRDLAGRLISPAVYERDGLYADIEIYPHWAPVVEAMWRDIGMSIRASGTVEPSNRPDIPGPIVTALTDVESVDLVTAAGAGGKIVALLESARARSGRLRRAAEALVAEAKTMKISDKPWSDITQADYSIEQWRRACLIGPSEPSDRKSDYKLPVREPDGTLNRNAVHAAASRIGQVDAPASAIKAAARKLVALYGQLEEEPPESLAKLAGQARQEEATPPFADDEGDGPDDLDDVGGEDEQQMTEAAALAEARNIGAWLEARIHRFFSEIADEMYGEGNLTRAERLALSSAVGDALEAFARRIGADVPHLYERDIFDDLPGPAPAADAETPGTQPANQIKEEGSMPDKITEAEVSQLRDAQARALEEAAREKARAEEAELRLARFTAVEAARPIAAQMLAESGLPGPAQGRLLAAVTADSVPLTESRTLDEDTLRRQIDQAVKAEAAYLAQLAEATGAGQVRGLGESARGGGAPAPASDPEVTTALIEAYKQRGLPEEAARLAAMGRP